MKNIPKVHSLHHKITYSKAYRAPKWLFRKILNRNIQRDRNYLVDMRLGHQMQLRPTQRYLENVIYSGQYHDENIFFVRPLISKGSIILDIGANIGLYTCAYAQYFKEEDIKIYAIEAVETNFNVLKENIRLNRFKNIQADHLALGKEEGELTFHLPSKDFVGNAVGANVHQENSSDVYEAKVKMITLDTYAQQNGIDRCDFMKIDVEGAEYFVFEGGRNFLSQCRPVIEAEYNSYWLKQVNKSFRDFAQFFVDLDYLCAVERKDCFEVISDPLEYSINEGLVDLLFVPREKWGVLKGA